MNTKQLTEAVKALQEASKPKIGDWRVLKIGLMHYCLEKCFDSGWWPLHYTYTLNGARKYIISRIGTDNANETENVVAYFTK